MTNLLVSGATGTFGRTFFPAALKSNRYSRIAIYSRDEAKQHELQATWGAESRLRWFIGDVRDYDRLLFALRGVDEVVHAAALKHVPSGERNPFEHVKTNVLGSQNVAMASTVSGVKKVLGVSTDKAVEPTTLYGATKLCMERLFVAFNGVGSTRFACVRYGNVLGSRGSFLETLHRLKAEGAKTFPLRDKNSTRFWMSAEAASQFVLAKLEEMQGGEIFIPKLPSSSALQFAKDILPDAEPVYQKMPPGEKVHETLISCNESLLTEERETDYVIRPHGKRRAGEMFRYTSNEQMVMA